MSLGQLCDDDCKVELDKKNLKVFKKEKLIMKGHRNKSDGLWDTPITRPIITNNVILPVPHPGIYQTRTCLQNNSKTSKKLSPTCSSNTDRNLNKILTN